MKQRVGIVGTGWVAERHVEALGRIADARIAAIAGRNSARAVELAGKAARAETAKGTGATEARPALYADWAEMLAREKLDAVFVLLPPHLHGELELTCAARVPAVLAEKPLARDLATAERALEAFAAAGTFAAAAYMNRCRRSVLRARELFAAPDNGAVLIEGRWVVPVPPPAWWRDRSLSGGQFVEQCTHLVDIARFVAGKIVEVSALSTRGFIDDLEGYAADDAMVVSARFASGTLAQFSTGCFPRRGLDEDGGIGMTIGSRKTRCTLSGWGMALRAETASGETETVGADEDIFEIEDRLFLRAAASGDRRLFPSSYADGLETLRVTLAADESAASGHPISLT